MRIGLTFDLRETYLALGWSEHDVAEFDRVETIDAIAGALAALGHEPDRIGDADALIGRLAGGDAWDLVLNIAEGRRGTGREALVPALLEHAGIPHTFGDALCCAVTLDKPTCKRVLRDHGIPTPDFVVVRRADEADRVDLPFPVFAKPVREGSGKGVGPSSRCRTPDELRAACGHLLAAFRQPVLVERLLPGPEVTVGVLGTGDAARVLGVLGVRLPEGVVYGYDTKERCEEVARYELVVGPFAEAAGEVALAAYRAAGCRDGGRVDVMADERGRPSVLEINPLAGLHPTHSDLPITATLTGLGFEGLIGAIIDSARERLEEAATPCAR